MMFCVVVSFFFFFFPPKTLDPVLIFDSYLAILGKVKRRWKISYENRVIEEKEKLATK